MELKINEAVAGLQPSGIRMFSALARSTPGAMMLTIGEPDLNTPENVKDAVTASLAANDTHYPDNNGKIALRQAISAFEAKHSGLHYDPEEIIVTCGATEALFAALFTILNPGDEVIIPTPAFGLYQSIAEMCRAAAVNLPTEDNDFQIDPERLAAAITDKTKAIILTSPNNPTGRVYSRKTLDAIHEILRDKPIFVLCDEVYRQLVYTGEYASFADYTDMRDRIIVIQSYSKPYAMTGWRMGYLMADSPIREKIRFVHQYTVVSVPSFLQTACAEALDTDISASRELFRRRRDYVYQRLTDMGFNVALPEGAFYFFLPVAQFGMDSMTFATRLLQEGLLALVPGICFGTEGYVRLSYCYGDDVLKEGMDRLEKFVKTL